jgi:hypothetical protein
MGRHVLETTIFELAPGDDLAAVDFHVHAERTGGAAHEEARTAFGEEGMAAAWFRRRGADIAEMFFERPCNSIRLDHQHGNAVGLRPGTPVGRNVGKIMCDEQRDAKIRIVVMEL